MIGLGWLAYVRTDYRDSANNESHFFNPTLYLRGMLEEVVDRPNLGQKRPLCSKDHHNNLHDRTRTVAWGKNYEQRHR